MGTATQRALLLNEAAHGGIEAKQFLAQWVSAIREEEVNSLLFGEGVPHCHREIAQLLAKAIDMDQVDQVRALTEAGVSDSLCKLVADYHPMAHAAQKDRVTCLRELRHGCESVTVIDSGATTSLMTYAAMTGSIGVIRYLATEVGVDVNQGTCGGFSPLMIAAMCGSVCAVQELLAVGADRNMVNAIGQTASILAKDSCRAIL